MIDSSAEPHYSIGQLAEAAAISRRTVHFYVQQQLIDPPVGLGRGSYYTEKHLEQLRRVLTLQREGLPLARIQALPEAVQVRTVEQVAERNLVLRVSVAPGITLELAAGEAMPTPGQVKEIAQLCAQVLNKQS